MFSPTIFRLQCSWAYYFFPLPRSLTYYGGFAEPLLVSSPSWHHTVLQSRGVGAHAELSRQIAVKAASSARWGQAGRLASRDWLVGLVPSHGLRHFGRVSPMGKMDAWETWVIGGSKKQNLTSGTIHHAVGERGERKGSEYKIHYVFASQVYHNILHLWERSLKSWPAAIAIEEQNTREAETSILVYTYRFIEILLYKISFCL